MPGDVDHYTRIRAYKVVVERYYDSSRTLLSLLPRSMRMAGPREAFWHAIIRRNFGATDMIIGRDHAGPGNNRRPYEARELLERCAEEIGIQPVPFSELVYLADEEHYEVLEKVPEECDVFSISATQVREEYLSEARPLAELVYGERGCRYFAGGLSFTPRAGLLCLVYTIECFSRSTTAEVLAAKHLERGGR